MKKKLSLTTAIIATLSLSACGKDAGQPSTPQNTATPTATAIQETDKQNNTESSSAPVETTAPAEPTVTPEPTATPEPTVTPTEAPAVTEVSWEESGMSYELFENSNPAEINGAVTVIVTNNSDTTYYCDGVYYFELEPNGKWYQLFYSMSEAENFVSTITTSPFVTQTRENCFTTELPCTITSDNSTGENYEEYSYREIEFKSNNALEYFNKMTTLTLTNDEYYNSFIAFSCTQSYGVVILYNENDEIIAITETSIEPIDNSRTEFTGKISLSKDIEFSKITMFMQYVWLD